MFDVRIRLKEWETFPPAFPANTDIPYTNADDSALPYHPNLRVRASPGREHVCLFYGDGARFAVERRGREVWADWPENYTLEDACTYLLGPVMGFVLRLRGTVCLHASAVALGDRAIALAGLPGAGKSTTAAAFACAGFPVLSDDIVALVDKGTQFLVQPGYPRVNLWPDSVRTLFGSEDALPRITPTWNKLYMPLGKNSHRFASSPLPLGAIYILDSRDAALEAPVIEEVSGEEAFMALVANTYVNYLLDQNMRRTEFEVLSRVVSEIPIRRVRPPSDPSAIFKLCDAIAANARQAMAPAPPNVTSVHG
ncbi:MAG TPA: hypothetical protein VFN26_00775 [Candidatus Acidoferrum sp.]|nr:hypothetical protein [Candidatus Acidoferrum sp.]